MTSMGAVNQTIAFLGSCPIIIIIIKAPISDITRILVTCGYNNTVSYGIDDRRLSTNTLLITLFLDTLI